MLRASCLRSLPAGFDLNRIQPVSLAYLGDAVFEAACREKLLWPPTKVNELSSAVQAIVCAEGQYKILQRVLEGFDLSDDEHEWLRRGRNASGRGPRRLEPKVYRASTSFETLVGVLHLTDSKRLDEFLDFVFDEGIIAELPPSEA